jgi:hypothetical protein
LPHLFRSSRTLSQESTPVPPPAFAPPFLDISLLDISPNPRQSTTWPCTRCCASPYEPRATPPRHTPFRSALDPDECQLAVLGRPGEPAPLQLVASAALSCSASAACFTAAVNEVMSSPRRVSPIPATVHECFAKNPARWSCCIDRLVRCRTTVNPPPACTETSRQWRCDRSVLSSSP